MDEDDGQPAASANGVVGGQTKRALQLQLQEAKLNLEKESGLSTSLFEVPYSNFSAGSFCAGMREIGIAIASVTIDDSFVAYNKSNPSASVSVGDQVVAVKVTLVTNLSFYLESRMLQLSTIYLSHHSKRSIKLLIMIPKIPKKIPNYVVP
jgi:hypothetical protein